MIRTNTATALACVLTVLTVALAACGSDPAPTAQPTVAESGMKLDADYSGAGQVPGALISATVLPTVDRRLRSSTSLAARVEYTSTSGITDGSHPRLGIGVRAEGQAAAGRVADPGVRARHHRGGTRLRSVAVADAARLVTHRPGAGQRGLSGDDARLPGAGYGGDLSPLPRLHHRRLQHDRRGARGQETGAGGLQKVGGRWPFAGRAGGVGGQRTGRELRQRPGSAGIGQPFAADRPHRLRHRSRRGHPEQGSASGASADPRIR